MPSHFPQKLRVRLEDRARNNALRTLPSPSTGIDFASNDYLGFARSTSLHEQSEALLKNDNPLKNGATGSRLLTGNHRQYDHAEQEIAAFHRAESALIFNSGYDANLGFFSTVPQRADIVLYDQYIHGSIRDGLRMSHARAIKFRHNDLEDLKKRCSDLPNSTHRAVYVVTESVFSMDGDAPDLSAFAAFCQDRDYLLIVDEAHATGVCGPRGEGLAYDLELEQTIFARIITFGKALGTHGAAVLGGAELKTYLINFARSLIYTTGLPPHTIANTRAAYQMLQDPTIRNPVTQLQQRITYFNQQLQRHGLDHLFTPSISAIHSVIIPGNQHVKSIAQKIQHEGFEVKAILSPTVPKGQERLRICIHRFNSEEEIEALLKLLATFVAHNA